MLKEILKHKDYISRLFYMRSFFEGIFVDIDSEFVDISRELEGEVARDCRKTWSQITPRFVGDSIIC